MPEPAPASAKAAEVPSAVPSPGSAEPTRSSVKEVACGASFACALTEDGAVRCWGRNDNGQLGTNTRANLVAPPQEPVEELAPTAAITAGDAHLCALLEGGRVACWGSNAQGQVGDGSTVLGFDRAGNSQDTGDRLRPAAVVGLPEPATAVVATASQSCAILASKRVACWGGTFAGSSVPTVVAGLAGVEELAVGVDHACARLAAGEVTCWGNGLGARGGGLQGVTGLCAKQITAGDRFACALSCTDEVLCWGEPPLEPHSQARPTRVPSLPADLAEVRAGAGHVCARDRKGRVSCWGDNADGQLGAEGPKRRPTAKAPYVPGVEARRVCAGGASAQVGTLANGQPEYGYLGTTCAVSTSGEVRCWGGAVAAKQPTLVDLPR